MKSFITFAFTLSVGVWSIQSPAQTTSASSADTSIAAEVETQQSQAEHWINQFDIALGVTGLVQSTMGADQSICAENDVTDASRSVDLEISSQFSAANKFYSLIVAGSGDGIDGDICTFSGFNGDADNDPTFRFAELWVEHAILPDKLALTVGKLDLTSRFDANEVANSETGQFLSGGFINNLATEFPDDNSFGAMLWLTPHRSLNLGMAVADADADWENVFEGNFSMIEVDFITEIAGRTSNLRAYGWFNDKDHVSLALPSDSTASNRGAGLSIDQAISKDFHAFGRMGFQDDEIAEIGSAYSFGLRAGCGLLGRPDDAVGVAYGVNRLGHDYELLQRDAQISTADEVHAELYYSFTANNHLVLSPDLQWVQHADGVSTSNDLLSFGMRAQLGF